MANFCKQCGAPVNPEERFCPQCGAPLGAAPTQNSEPQPRPEPVHEDAYAEEKAQGVDWKQLRPKLTIGKPEVTFISKKKLILVGIVLVVILILALFTK
jgi:uncharacterized membrane protein YvbJ